MRIIQALLLSFFVFFSSFCFANDYFDQIEMTEKIYVSHDQIVLTETGMFIAAGNSLIPVNQINCDNNGFYIPPVMAWTKDQCPKGHYITCRRCNGCNWRRCEYACKCR